MQAIKIGNSEIEYQVIRSNRKTLGLEFSKDEGLKIRAPKKADQKDIEKVIRKKTAWILKTQEKLSKIKDSPRPKDFVSGEKLAYIGRRYRLKVRKKEMEGVKVSLFQGKFYIDIDVSLKGDKRREEIRKEIINWYREHAEKKINQRVEKYKTQLGVEPNSVRIKTQKKRWGSCSSKGNLNFNWSLILARMSVIDYIVVHELSHLVYQDHSKDFWNLVASIIPDYKEKKDWLMVNGNSLQL